MLSFPSHCTEKQSSREISHLGIAIEDLTLNFDYSKYTNLKNFKFENRLCEENWYTSRCDPLNALIKFLKNRIPFERGITREEYERDFNNLISALKKTVDETINYDISALELSEGKLTVVFNGAVALNPMIAGHTESCLIKISIHNQLGYDLSSNSIILSILGGNINSDLARMPFQIPFNKLKNGNSIYAWLPLFLSRHHLTDCQYKNMFRSTSLAYPFSEITINIQNIDQLFKDGFRRPDAISFKSNGPESFAPKVFISSQVEEGIKRQNPTYREQATRRESCRMQCQKRLEECVIQYKGIANQMCGLPNSQCFNQCEVN